MKFSEFKYVRPDVEKICADLDALTAKFAASSTAPEQIKLIEAYRDILIDFNSARTIASIRHTINTQDPTYIAENKFFNQNNPKIDKSMVAFGMVILNSKHIPDIKKAFGNIFITNMELKAKSMTPEIVTLMQEENALVSEYQSFNAKAQIEFRGEKYTIPAITNLMSSDDRATRKEAYEAFSKFNCDNKQVFDELYDKLVKNRTEQAKKMGLNSYTELGYIRRNRNCFTPANVEVFRKQVLEDIVPAVSAAKKQQAARINIPDMKIYDNDIYFADGNPKTFPNADDMMQATAEAFRELSPITKDYINLMMEGQYYDAPSRPGKRVGAYCNYIPNQKAPFVFLNYAGNGTDITTTFHEFGHGLNCYFMRDDINSVLCNSTLDIAEVHSMSMEFMSYPGWGKFFNETDLIKAKRGHIEHCLAFIAYGTMVDHFQHIMYDQPNLTPEERNKVWRELDAQYRPHMDFDNIEYYETGRTWQRQQHIFSSPFYYIDYVLAETIALQFWQIGQKNHKAAFDKYIEFTRHGGNLTFVDVVKSVGLKSPFEAGALKDIAVAIGEEIK